METDRLRYFCAIVDTGSLTKASEVMGISHSGLSKAMSVLQNEVSIQLFIPKGRGLELTENGKVFYEQSRKILELVNSLKITNRPTDSVLRLGFPEVMALTVAEAITRELNEGIIIEEYDSGEIESEVLNRRIDFGFTFIPFPHKELEHIKISSVTLTSHRRVASFLNINPDQIPYVIPSSEIADNPLSIRIRDGWNSSLSRLTPFRANSLSIALNMVQSGVCAVYAPLFLRNYINAKTEKSRHLVDLNLSSHRKNQELTRRDIFLVKKNSSTESKSMKKIIRIVKQVCNEQ